LKEQPSFELIYKKFRPALMGFAMSITRSLPDAEEVVNDVFVGIWERHSEMLSDPGLKSYLFRSVKNRCLNNIKRQRLPFDEMPDEMPVASKDHGALDQLEAKEMSERITLVIDKLPTKCKQVFLLSRMHEMSYKEIAELMDISPKTVENQIGIALKFLRESFPGH
jgi:RNA polymerase sigma-70 factor (ECF subfamily)